MTQSNQGAASTFRVSAASNPASVAGAIAGVVREVGTVTLSAIGAGAVNQAVKAIAIARGYVAAGGLNLVCVPAFKDQDINGEEKTVMEFRVFPA